jgi:putative ABC transport system substrate-binding protein
VNHRRALLFLLGAAALAQWTLWAQAKPPVVVGLLHPGSRQAMAHRHSAFKEGLAALGWREGTQVVFEERWADGRAERLPALAEELAARRVAVIVTGGSPPVAAAIKAAPNTPIVMATIGDPVASGFVPSLARPGGMITGLASITGSVTEKYLELLLEIAPKLKRVGFLFDSSVLINTAHMEAARRSSTRLGVDVRYAEAAGADEIEAAVSRLARDGIQALVVMPSTIFAADRQRILNLALAQRWPVVAQTNEYAEAGALLSYGADPLVSYRRAAYYVDRILKGTRPGDLPIELPTTFVLTVNSNEWAT